MALGVMKIIEFEGYELVSVWWLIALAVLTLVIAHLNMLASIFVEAVVVLIGLVLLITSIYKAARARSRRTVVVAVLVMLVGVAWMSPLRQVASVYARALIDVRSNSEIVEDLRRGKQASCASHDRCIVDRSGDLRVAFVWDGIVDNWYGMVYDAQGSVLDIGASKDAFGGDLVSSRHLWGPWYFCTFK
jgi:hypothetical protein